MKKVMFALFALTVGVSANAMIAPAKANTVVTVNQDDKVKIKAEELPQTVKTALEGEEYRGWLINAAYHHKSKDIFEIELKNGAETKTVKFDKDGKKVA